MYWGLVILKLQSTISSSFQFRETTEERRTNQAAASKTNKTISKYGTFYKTIGMVPKRSQCQFKKWGLF